MMIKANAVFPTPSDNFSLFCENISQIIYKANRISETKLVYSKKVAYSNF